MTGKPIRLNAFNMNCVGHINHGLWTHPRDRSTDYRSLAYWTDLARLLERGLFDGLFIADIVGVYDVYGQSLDLTLRESIQLPVNDPMMLVSAMAAATQHLGFGITVNLTYEAPYLLARRFSTLDHLSGGRIGWNIVTGYLDSAARAMGLAGQIEHDERYDRADEYLEVAYKLWEGSWEDGAVRRDREARVFADPAKVHRIRHRGRFYDVDGYHLAEPSPQRTPVLFQAGSSGRGQQFAARHAECVFVSSGSRAGTRKLVAELRRQAAEAGRDPAGLKIFMGVTVIVGRTEAEAREKFAEYARHASPEAGLAHFAAGSGIDYSRFDLDDVIAPDGTKKTARHRILGAARHRRPARFHGARPARPDGAGRALRDHRRRRLAGGRRADRLDRRDRYRRLQPGAHRHAGKLRGFHRAGDPRAAGARPLQDRLCRGHAAREAVRRRGHAAGSACGRGLSPAARSRRRALMPTFPPTR